MKRKLLIAEKRRIAESYVKLLTIVENENFQEENGYFKGEVWDVTWGQGHLVTLAEPEEYGYEWKIKDLPMIPEKWKYTVIEKTKYQFNIIKKLTENAQLIVNGADAGREGELIFRLVLNKIAETKSFTNVEMKRLWLSETTLEGMKKGWEKLLPLKEFDNLYISANTRQKTDWLIGMTLSRAYMLAANNPTLSIGRVQTCLLYLITKRDFEIENWKQKFFYQLIVKWNGFDFTYFDDEKNNNFDDQKTLEPIQRICENKTAVLTETKKDSKKENPPPLLNLAKLQKEANIKYKLTAEETLNAAQKLYDTLELITYPRTDSNYLPVNMKEEVYQRVRDLCDEKEKDLLSEKMDFFNNEKITDHFAIIPTAEKPKDLDGNEKKVYQIVRDRFVLAFMKERVYIKHQLTLQSDEYKFKNTTIENIESGYRKSKLYTLEKDNKEEEKESKKVNFQENDKATIENPEIKKKEKTKPKYHTEATLISTMERTKIGTAATQASTIEKLKKREYVTSEKNNIISTSKGRELIKMVDKKHYEPDVTANMEQYLHLIEKGKGDSSKMLERIEERLKEIDYENLNVGNLKIEKEVFACPICKEKTFELDEKKAKCSSCEFIIWMKIAGKKISKKDFLALIEGKTTELIDGFVNKDKKKFSMKLKINIEEKKVDFVFEDKIIEKGCPACKEDLRNTKSGFFCKNDNCDFILWRNCFGKKLSDDTMMELIKNNKTKKEITLKSKKTGKNYNALLTMGKLGKVSLDFPETKKGGKGGKAKKGGKKK